MKKKVVAAFLAICMVCQGSMAYAAQPEVLQETEMVTPETPEEEIEEEEVNGIIVEERENAEAAGTIDNSTIYWSVSGDTLTIANKGANNPIPDYTYEGVTPWDSYRYTVKEVVIGSGITEIGDYAFKDMKNLQKVTINSGVLTSIGAHAFDNCKNLKEINLPDTLTHMGVYAFARCGKIEKISSKGAVTPASLKEIPEYAFAESDIKEIVFSEAVEKIGLCAFYNCDNLTTVSFAGTSLKTIEDCAFMDAAKLESVVIPDGVETIGVRAFYGCGCLNSVGMKTQGSLTDIGTQAFDKCNNDIKFYVMQNAGYVTEYLKEYLKEKFEESCILYQYMGNEKKDTYTIQIVGDTTYTGNPITPKVMITLLGGGTLQEGTDYTLSYSNNVEAGNSAKITITGINAYYGSMDEYFTISKRSIEDANIKVGDCMGYTGDEVVPSLTIKHGNKVLEEGVDYTVEYSNNVNVGDKAKITITGINLYTGVVEKYFTVTAVNIKNNATVDYVKEWIYTGDAITPEVTVKVNGVTLVQNKDYTVGYSNNVKVGTNAKIVITGIGGYTGTVKADFSICAELKNATVTVKNQTYTGKKLTPSVSVVLNGMTLVKDKDYTVTYSGNKNIGKNAKVVVKGIGNYKGQISKTFTIAPAKAKIKVSGYKIKVINYKKGADVYLTVKVAGKKAVKIQCTAKKYKKKKCVDLTSYLKKYKGKKATITVYMKANGVQGASAKKTIKKL